jgi:magnesium-transporting ATPase (P-type)
MTGESKQLKKTTDEHPHEDATPFLISGSKITDGAGFGLVLAVGVHSQMGILRMSMQAPSEDTPLQLKLQDLGDMIGRIGMAGAALTVAGCTIGLIYGIMTDDKVDLADEERPVKLRDCEGSS